MGNCLRLSGPPRCGLQSCSKTILIGPYPTCLHNHVILLPQAIATSFKLQRPCARVPRVGKVSKLKRKKQHPISPSRTHDCGSRVTDYVMEPSKANVVIRSILYPCRPAGSRIE